MKKVFITILIPLVFAGCSNHYPTNKIGAKHTQVLDEGVTQEQPKYRNNLRYRGFDHKHLGYSSSNGLYYGYFDDMGYYYNDVYFPYDDRYTYPDRVHHRGYFSPKYIRIPRPKFRVYHPQD